MILKYMETRSMEIPYIFCAGTSVLKAKEAKELFFPPNILWNVKH